MKRIGSFLWLAFWGIAITGFCEEADEKVNVEQSLRSALSFMQTLQRNGGWAMRWTSDYQMTWGEHAVRPREIITVQPPATPGTAGTYLRAYQILKEPEYLSTAIQAGEALVKGQLECGGFPHEFIPGKIERKPGTFDDDVTQGATRYLLALWKETQEQKFLDSVKRCAQFMLDAQYENGGWPQAYPLSKGYSRYITLNDDAMMDVIRTLFLLYHELGDQRYYEAAVRGADCLLQLQGEPPQAGWAQQFTPEGAPAPARRFEPVGLSSAESIGVLRLLLEVYLETGDKKYLEAGPPAFEWLKASILPNGKLARLYQYGDNRPIYSTEEGEIIYDVSLARAGYSWQGHYWDSRLQQLYAKLMEAPVEKRKDIAGRPSHPSLDSLKRAAQNSA
ncbi:MAG: pectate lyase, partial [Candidatus Hinthialibacter sp.]